MHLPDPDYVRIQRILLPYVFIGDAAFPLKIYMLKPYLDIFNYCPSRARWIIVNVFGILAKKFQIFCWQIIAETEKVAKITKAACVFHNYFKIYEAQTQPV